MKRIEFKTVDSTNTLALSHFETLEDKTAISADEQTKGKGRFDRTWVSEDFENIYLSLVLKPEKKDYIANLTQYLSVVTAKTLEIYRVSPEIKWPNDVLLQGKKIAGILCEVSSKQNVIQGVVLGIGINLNMPEDIINNIDRPATSLNLLLKRKIDKKEFLNKLLDEFFTGYEKVVENGFKYIKEDYLNYINFLGRHIKIQQRDGAERVEYIAKEINDEGNLIVFDSKNSEKTIYSGDLLL